MPRRYLVGVAALVVSLSLFGSLRVFASQADLIAACFNTRRILGIEVGPDEVRLSASIGTGPQSLATLRNVVLIGDLDQRIYQASLADFSQLPETVLSGNSPNHILAEEPYLYVVNSLSDTLKIFQARAGGAEPLGLQEIGRLSFEVGSSPQAIAKIGNELYVPLFGPLSGGPGQVARVNVSDPRSPVLGYLFDLSSIDLMSDGRTYAFPASIAAHRGQLYVALGNFSFAPPVFGPGILAKIDPEALEVSGIPLGGDVCFNAFWVRSAGEILYVSCGGKVTYGPDFTVSAVEKSALVAIGELDQRLDYLSFTCPDDAPQCKPPSLGRFAVAGNRVYAGDLSGRIFVSEWVDERLRERRGYHSACGGPIEACSDGRFVSDVIAVSQ